MSCLQKGLGRLFTSGRNGKIRYGSRLKTFYLQESGYEEFKSAREFEIKRTRFTRGHIHLATES